MSNSLIRRLVAALMLLVVLLAWPGTIAATIDGGCTGEGHSTSSSADLTTDTVWHLKQADIAGGSGTSPGKIHAAGVVAYALGIGLPIASGTSDEGKTAGSVDGVNVATYAVLGRRFVVGGSATGDTPCKGQIEVIIDDVNPLFTVLGGGGTILAVIGLIALLLFSRSKGGCAYRIISAIVCGFGGLGAALALEQFGVIDPTSFVGLLILIGAAVLGFVTCGLFGGGGAASDVPPAPAPTA